MKFCAEGGCPGIATTGDFCESHKEATTRKTQNAPRHVQDKWYALAAWKGPYGVRAYKLKRNPQCEICGAAAQDVHHLRPWKDSASWFVFMGGIDMEFLQSLCKRCHARITMNEFQFGPGKKLER